MLQFVLSSGLWTRIFFVAVGCAGLLAVAMWIRSSELQFARSQAAISSLGLNTLVVQSRTTSDEGLKASTSGPDGNQRGLSTENVEELVKLMPRVEAMARSCELAKPLQITVKGRSVDATVFGCEPDLAKVINLQVEPGRFLAANENVVRPNDKLSLSCVISAELAEKLFPYEESIGKRVHLINDSYPVVVGVLKPRDAKVPSLLVQETGSCIFISFQHFTTMFMNENAKPGLLNHLAIRLADTNAVDSASSSIDAVIKRFGLQSNAQVIVTKSMLDQVSTARASKAVFQIGLLVTISLITLLAVIFATYAEGQQEAENINASRGSRLRAQIFDGLIGAPFGILFAIASLYWPQLRRLLALGRTGLSDSTDLLAAIAVILTGFAIYLLIHRYPIVMYGQSWGKRMCGIAVVDRKTGVKVGLLRFFMRELIKFLFGCAQFAFRYTFLSTLDFCFIFSQSRRCLHDWLAQTCVVKVNQPSQSAEPIQSVRIEAD